MKEVYRVRQGDIIYTSSKHIAEIKGNGGIKGLKKEWEDMMGMRVRVVDTGKTLVVRLKGNERLRR